MIVLNISRQYQVLILPKFIGPNSINFKILKLNSPFQSLIQIIPLLLALVVIVIAIAIVIAGASMDSGLPCAHSTLPPRRESFGITNAKKNFFFFNFAGVS